MDVIAALQLVQVYEFNDSETGKTYYWNATKGYDLAIARNATPHQVYPADFGMTAARIREMYPDLDEQKALNLPDSALKSPLLFVEHRQKHVLCDGWHRLYKAVRQGRAWLPAYVLTAFESARIECGGPDGRPL